MYTKIVDIFAILILHFLQSECTANILSCNVTRLPACPKYQKCIEASNECVCIEGYIREDNECVEPSSVTSAGRDATAAVVSIFTIVLIVLGLTLVIRKYNLVSYVQQKINSRRNNDIIYEDVMIGQDDPPLVP